MFTLQILGYQIKGAKLDWACSMNGEGEKCVQNFDCIA
jgi:hypothetical protein